MVNFSLFTLKQSFERMTAGRRGLLSGGLFASVLLLGGCAVEVENYQPHQELVARPPQPQGSVYLGWRVFQDKCARCHGPAGTGTASAPDLLPVVREMGTRRFVSLVLKRYDLSIPVAQANSGGAASETMIDVIVQRRDAPLTMPAWEDNPRVSAHILDLYAYLWARAEGTQGPGRPEQ